MYGMVNKAVEEMVVMHHGEPVWERIKAKAGIEVDVFMSNESYPDEVTYALVAAASDILGTPAEKILEAFGEHWVLHTAQEGYGGLLRAGGKTLPEFLANLPNFHTRVAMIFPNLQPPSFSCTDVGPSSLHLHYLTHRPGMTAFVVGLIQGLGKMFRTPVVIRIVESKAEGADHDVFHVQWSDSQR